MIKFIYEIRLGARASCLVCANRALCVFTCEFDAVRCIVGGDPNAASERYELVPWSQVEDECHGKIAISARAAWLEANHSRVARPLVSCVMLWDSIRSNYLLCCVYGNQTKESCSLQLRELKSAERQIALLPSIKARIARPFRYGPWRTH